MARRSCTSGAGATIVEKTPTEHAGGGLQVDIKLIAQGKTIAQPVALRRYAVADHLGSSKLGADPAGEVIAYEEFYPYGSSSYRAMRLACSLQQSLSQMAGRPVNFMIYGDAAAALARAPSIPIP
ncbi:MAG: hypothetical protein U0168_25485 [Nannocystaceae bacterium]